MKKDFFVSVLLDVYQNLLTSKQADILSLYYNEDLSLSEITEHYDVTRQAVLDIIKRAEKQLYHYEERLGLARRTVTMEEKLKQIAGLVGEIVRIETAHTVMNADVVGLAKQIAETADSLE